MTYYHANKKAAIEAGEARFGGRWNVNAELVPWNGWVIVLRPLSLDYIQEPLEPILAYAEVRIEHTIRRLPPEYKKPPKASEESTGRSARRRRRSGRDKPVAAPVAPPPPPSRPTGAAAAPPPPPPKRP
jgi:hypothetical protein